MSYANDYFSRRAGYVIEGRSFNSAADASQYLINTCGMDEEESTSYINRLRKEFRCRTENPVSLKAEA